MGVRQYTEHESAARTDWETKNMDEKETSSRKPLLIGAAIVVVVLLLGVVGFSWMQWRATQDTVRDHVGGADGVVGTLPTESAP